MDKLINNLLLLAKTDNMSQLKQTETFNLSEEVNLVSSMFESMAYEKKISIQYNVQDNIKFNGNKEDIKQILSVLIDNAIMHTRENGKVIIELEKEKNITIQVKNEGEPIPEDEREKIFERFYRVDKARNRKEKRYGLGLSIAKSIVEQYNGKQVSNNFGRQDIKQNFNGVVATDTIDTIDAVVDYEVILELLGIGVALTLFSSLASMISIQKFSPLTILKERS